MKRYNNTVIIKLYSLQVIKLIVPAERKNTVINNHITRAYSKWHIVGKIDFSRFLDFYHLIKSVI